VLVPRHFERCKDLGRELQARGEKFMFRSEILPETRLEPGTLDCLLVNTTGELKFFYEPATVVFIGKSLTATGGQNPIEPAALGKPVVFGPNMQNFGDIVRIFNQKKAVEQVIDVAELEHVLRKLLADTQLRAALGSAAHDVVAENLGAVNRTVELILPHLESRGVWINQKK
jgi:3-deoxy-D-manno-octulosonic-acid transferase